MRLRIAGLIVVAMMLVAMVPTASAGQLLIVMGTVSYENEAWVPDGWQGYAWNLNQSYNHAPFLTEVNPFMGNIYVTTEYDSDNDYIAVNCTSPDGMWYGENACKKSDAWNSVIGCVIVNVTVYPVVQQPDTFTKSLPPGWNLISLPLTPLDSSVSAVLGNDTIAYDAVKEYDATTKTFADATTMAPGTGYFVHVTTAGDWTYEGTPETSTSPGLKSGLNMIGVPNCTMSVSDAMGTTDYRYVARWNADDQKYEVYNPAAPEAFYGFTEMTAGEGYFVSAKSDDVDWTVSCP